MVTVAETAYVRAELPSNRRPDARELRALGRQLDARNGSFPFAHARLAWLESHGGATP